MAVPGESGKGFKFLMTSSVQGLDSARRSSCAASAGAAHPRPVLDVWDVDLPSQLPQPCDDTLNHIKTFDLEGVEPLSAISISRGKSWFKSRLADKLMRC